MNRSASESGERVAPGEIEELRKALDEEQQRYLRLLAEFDNFRRRMARDAQGSRDAGRREALLPLLDPALTVTGAIFDFHDGAFHARA